LSQIIKSLYQVSKDNGNAWEGNLIDLGGRIGLRTPENELVEFDSLLPGGETGKFMLIWMKDDSESLKREV